MSKSEAEVERSGVGRLGTAAGWISALCCLPYLILKVVWTLGMPVGITDRSQLDSDGWVAANALMAAIQLAGLLLVLALTQPWARSVPAWLLLFPAWVGIGLLFQVVVGAVLMGLFAPPTQASSADLGGFQPWVFAVVYASFAGQGVALAIAFACYVRARWGRLLGAHTGEVLAGPTARARWWPERHLAGLAVAVAWMAVALGIICSYWAAGGSVGLSDAQPHPPWYLHASRVAGCVVVVVGLLSVAGRWGHQRRFWVPVALLWVGSGALVAFDGMSLMLYRLFLMFEPDGSGPGWSLIDIVLMIKVLIGMSAAAVGVLTVTAAKDTQAESSLKARPPRSRAEPERRSDAETPVP